MNESQKQRHYLLDFLKILATIAVVFHHYQFVSGVRFENHMNFFGNRVFQWGIVVNLFFMISGFLAFRDKGVCTDKISFASFMGRKLNRLLPVAACSSIAYVMFNYLYYRANGAGFWIGELPDLWDLIVVCLGLNSGFGLDQMSVNNPLWFVSSLILCYCFYYLVSYVVRRKNLRLEWVLVFVVFFMLNMLQMGIEAPLMNGDAQKGYLFFSLGLLLGSFLHRYELNRAVCVLASGGVLLFFGFIVFAPAHMDVTNAFSFVLCPALIVLSQTVAAGKIFRHSFWQTLSEISYNVYVWHFTIQLFCSLFWPEWMSSGRPVDMYVFGAATWVIGAVSHYLLEKPLNRLLPVWWKKIFVKK